MTFKHAARSPADLNFNTSEPKPGNSFFHASYYVTIPPIS